MTFEKFKEQVKEQILSYLPEEYAGADISVQEVTKNNDQKMSALHIKRPEDRVVPNIYLDGFYQRYQDGWEMDKILSAVSQTHQKSMAESAQWQGFHIGDYDSVKDSLYITALNRECNQDYLKDVVHMDIPTLTLRQSCVSCAARTRKKETPALW